MKNRKARGRPSDAVVTAFAWLAAAPHVFIVTPNTRLVRVYTLTVHIYIYTCIHTLCIHTYRYDTSWLIAEAAALVTRPLVAVKAFETNRPSSAVLLFNVGIPE